MDIPAANFVGLAINICLFLPYQFVAFRSKSRTFMVRQTHYGPGNCYREVPLQRELVINHQRRMIRKLLF